MEGKLEEMRERIENIGLASRADHSTVTDSVKTACHRIFISLLVPGTCERTDRQNSDKTKTLER